MTVDVIVPWGGSEPHRLRAWEWVRAQYEEVHPTWNILVGGAPPSPWSKARAVDQALRKSRADTIVVADADVWVDNLDKYAETVESGLRRWAVPHFRVFRFNETGSESIYEEDVHPVDVALRRGVIGQTPYQRMLGGGIVIMERKLYTEAPIDPRFIGWGGEDRAWGLCLATIGGPRHQGEEMLWHLWHPPAERRDRAFGNEISEQLAERYREVAGNVEAMQALVEEGRAWASTSSS